ncbi:MAG: prepilin-type N-terminal cleavage/methylation domain-containing protein [Pseudomonadota bacterium]
MYPRSASLKARCGKHNAGFSLIEILVVLFVVVLLTSLVSLNLDTGGREREQRQTLDRLLAVAGLALDEATASGSDYGVLFVLDSNERGEPVHRAIWRQRRVAGWRAPIDDLELYEPIEFPPGTELFLSLDATDVALLSAEAQDEQAGRQPQWLLTASGETQTGELMLVDEASDELLWRATWDALGRFEVFRGDAFESEDSYANAR